MIFNNWQKIATIVFFLLIITILLFITPFYNYINNPRVYYNIGETIPESVVYGYGNFFTNTKIIYPKLFMELFVLTIFYSLSLIMLKKK